jgi:hypothetical protein
LSRDFALSPHFAQAQDKKDAAVTYHDKKNDRRWNGQEDKAYGIYQKDKSPERRPIQQAEGERSAELLELAAPAFRLAA